MMTIQTILNRVGALALGASQFTFSMIVACFVLCIALGSFAVSALRRIPPALLPVSQWLLVAILLALYPVIEDAPYWGHLLRSSFSNQDANFFPFHLAVFGAILGVFLVPLALSGATLPLLFHQLRREAGQLGSAAGSLYSWNTFGSLLGALLGGYALLFWLDLHQVYWLATMALAIGAVLLCARVSPPRPNGRARRPLPRAPCRRTSAGVVPVQAICGTVQTPRAAALLERGSGNVLRRVPQAAQRRLHRLLQRRPVHVRRGLPLPGFERCACDRHHQ